MELAIGARSVLRLLLTSLVLYSHIAAGQAPGSDMLDTLMDDEEFNVGKVGVQFTVNLSSKVRLNDRCSDGTLQGDIKSHVKAKLILAILGDCKCKFTESNIDKDEIECKSDQVVQYSGRISEMPSSTYTIKQLSEFINSWTEVIKVDMPKITLNVTSSQSSLEEFGSGDGMGGPGDNGDFNGSGDIVTIDMTIPGEDDENKGLGKVSGLDGESGELRAQVIGYVITLCTAFALLLSFV